MRNRRSLIERINAPVETHPPTGTPSELIRAGEETLDIGLMRCWSEKLKSYFIICFEESWVEDARNGWLPWPDDESVYSKRELEIMLTTALRDPTAEELIAINEFKKMGNRSWIILS